eukprot:SM000007S20881  [mRNA]  locus=s7:748213:749575:+ [translate_table: standard]
MVQSLREAFAKALASGPAAAGHAAAAELAPAASYSAALQRAAQRERHLRLAFAKRLQEGRPPLDLSKVVDVRVLEKSLEAHIAKCNCQVLRSPKGWLLPPPPTPDGQSDVKVYVIFSLKGSLDGDIEPQQEIRIHPPWQFWLHCRRELFVEAAQSKVIVCPSQCETLLPCQVLAKICADDTNALVTDWPGASHPYGVEYRHTYKWATGTVIQ